MARKNLMHLRAAVVDGAVRLAVFSFHCLASICSKEMLDTYRARHFGGLVNVLENLARQAFP